eukprot:gene31928-38602_t
MERAQKCATNIRTMMRLKDPQLCLLLLRSCFGMPQLTYSFRIAPPPALQEVTRLLETTLFDALRWIMVDGSPLQVDAPFHLSLASLPLHRKQQRETRALILTSAHKTQFLMSDLLSRFKRLQLARHAYLRQWTPARNILPQHSLLWASFDVQPLPPRASPDDAVSEAPYPLHSQWLLAIPNPRLGQKMEPLEFRAALAFRMFMPLCPPKTSCGNTCIQEVDIFGYHALSCLGKGNLLKQRHEVVLHAQRVEKKHSGFFRHHP